LYLANKYDKFKRKFTGKIKELGNLTFPFMHKKKENKASGVWVSGECQKQ
jgi:hypothetical protein